MQKKLTSIIIRGQPTQLKYLFILSFRKIYLGKVLYKAYKKKTSKRAKKIIEIYNSELHL